MLNKKAKDRGGKGNLLQIDKATGKVQMNRIDIAQMIAQLDEKDKKGGEAKAPPAGVANPNPGLEQDLLQAHRDRMIVEEQKMTQAVDGALLMAKKDLASDPDGVLEVLRGLYSRVKDHPDLGELLRDRLLTRLQGTLREYAGDARKIKLDKETRDAQVAILKSNIDKQNQRQSFEERLEAQFRAYRSLMNEARFETVKMQEMLAGMVEMEREAKIKGNPPPEASLAAYRITQSSYQLNHLAELNRRRQEGYLSVMLSIEKSHVPYADEPGIYFPPLATWKAIEGLPGQVRSQQPAQRRQGA